jgi:hypothetical protein
MEIVVNFLKSIPSVTTPLTLIAFIVVALLAALLFVLKSTGAIKQIGESLSQANLLQPGEFTKIVKSVLWVLVAIAAMLFALLAFESFGNQQKAKTQTGLACYADSCTGRDPKDSGCDKGVSTITSGLVSFPDLGKEFKNLTIEMRHSAKCNASWVKMPQLIGATIYFEDKDGKQYEPMLFRDDGLKEPHFTNMLSGDVERRACVSYPGKTPQCTGFVK